jgi:hypothetical protein
MNPSTIRITQAAFGESIPSLRHERFFRSSCEVVLYHSSCERTFSRQYSPLLPPDDSIPNPLDTPPISIAGSPTFFSPSIPLASHLPHSNL